MSRFFKSRLESKIESFMLHCCFLKINYKNNAPRANEFLEIAFTIV